MPIIQEQTITQNKIIATPLIHRPIQAAKVKMNVLLNKTSSTQQKENNKTYDEEIMAFSDDNTQLLNRNQINIAVIGPTSSGKSTLTNSIFVKKHEDKEINKTTYCPHVLYEMNDKELNSDIINSVQNDNDHINNNIQSKAQNGQNLLENDIQNIKYILPKTDGLPQLTDNINYTVHNIPGLNNSCIGNNELLYKLLNNNFNYFDIVLCVFDINNKLNSSDEIKILKNVIHNIKINYEKYGLNTELIIVLNKCDDMSTDSNGELRFLVDDLKESYEQIINVIETHKNNIYPDLKYQISKISAEFAFIYRTYQNNPEYNLDMKYVNKFGHNELGRAKWNKFEESQKREFIRNFMIEDKDEIKNRMSLNGFNHFTQSLERILTIPKQFEYLINHIKNELLNIDGYNSINNDDDFHKFLNIQRRIIDILNNPKYQTESDEITKMYNKILNNYLGNYYNKHINNKVSNINNSNIDTLGQAQSHLNKYKIFKESKADAFISKANKYMNEYYKHEIINKNSGFKICFEYLKKLANYECNETKELVKPLYDNDNTLNISGYEIHKSLMELEKLNIITYEERVIKSKEFLYRIHKAINNDRQIGFINNDMLSSYVYESWEILQHVKPKDNLDKQIRFYSRKNEVKFINLNNGDLKSYTHNMIEKYIYETE
jgi:hypothetical protein